MCGATKMDRIRNGSIRMKVGEISKKVQERRHVMRKDEDYVGKRMLSMDAAGKRRKGRPNRRWVDNVNVDLREERKKLYLTPNRQMYNASHIRYKIRAIYTHAYMHGHIYTIICLKSVWRRSHNAVRNSGSIASGDVSN